MPSRKLEDLLPQVEAKAREFLTQCREQGIEVLIYCTYRSYEEQAAEYAKGRTAGGRVVTNAPAGHSYHNHRRAFDCVPMRGSKPVWGIKGDDLVLWQKIANIAKSLGFEWGGDFKKFKDFPHFQYTEGKTIEDLIGGVGEAR